MVSFTNGRNDFSGGTFALPETDTRPFLMERTSATELTAFACELDQDDFTRFSVVACGSVSLPSMIALQVVVIVSASSKRSVNACMWDSFVGSIPQAASKS